MDPMIIAAIAAMGAIGAAYVTSRASNRKLRSDAGQQMIDQLQEENAGLKKELAAERRTRRHQDDYIIALRRHIVDGSPPPPPAWPDHLVT